ncbi:MAG: dTDP-4-amino-4,6-dideoxygalactose transaminase [Cyclobacteriaceae bacterium]|jgi:dTDP-4-amino-4,6-dideoxygalactose transaminase
MTIPFLDLAAQFQTLRPEIDQVISEVMQSGQYIGGEPVRKFEERIAQVHNVKHCVAVANGSDALYLALKAAGIGEGDEVITTAFSWIATAAAISQTGATPVFADVRRDNLQLDLLKAKGLLSPKTKAIVPVYLYGDLSHRASYLDFALEHDLLLVEDAAQVHGLPLPIESSRHLATFSFYPTKQLGAYGDAGAVICHDDQLAEQVRRIANQGALFPQQAYQVEGINSRMDTLQAAILTFKLPFLDSWITRRAEVAKSYQHAILGCTGIEGLAVSEAHTWYQFVVRAEDQNHFKQYLKGQRIGCATHYGYTLPGTVTYGQRKGYPVAEQAATAVVSLPIYQELTDEQVAYVCESLIQYRR